MICTVNPQIDQKNVEWKLKEENKHPISQYKDIVII